MGLMQRMMRALGRSFDVAEPEPGDVGGRPAYTTRITPRDDGGLLGAAEVDMGRRAAGTRCGSPCSPPATTSPSSSSGCPTSPTSASIRRRLRRRRTGARVTSASRRPPASRTTAPSSPACARSRARAGFDVALPRTLAGLPRHAVRLVLRGRRQSRARDVRLRARNRDRHAVAGRGPGRRPGGRSRVRAREHRRRDRRRAPQPAGHRAARPPRQHLDPSSPASCRPWSSSAPRASCADALPARRRHRRRAGLPPDFSRPPMSDLTVSSTGPRCALPDAGRPAPRWAHTVAHLIPYHAALRPLAHRHRVRTLPRHAGPRSSDPRHRLGERLPRLPKPHDRRARIARLRPCETVGGARAGLDPAAPRPAHPAAARRHWHRPREPCSSPASRSCSSSRATTCRRSRAPTPAALSPWSATCRCCSGAHLLAALTIAYHRRRRGAPPGRRETATR